MASYSRCDPKLLVVIVCGLLTSVVLGLAIWRTVLRIQRASPPSNVPIEFCRNGGKWKNGRCFCPEDWKGLRCTIVNFCEGESIGEFTFRRIPVGTYGSSIQTCGKDTPNAGKPMATVFCWRGEDGSLTLRNLTVGKCNETLKDLEDQIVDIATSSINISKDAQLLTSNANSLTAENISAAANVVGQIFNSSRNAKPEAKKIAVTTVSQLLNANEEVFKKAATDNENTLPNLIEEIEKYSMSLVNDSVVQPNIVVKTATFSTGTYETLTDVLFSVQKGSRNSFLNSLLSVTNVNTINPNTHTELQVLLHSTENKLKECGFVVYQNSKLFQSKTFTAQSTFSQRIVSSKASENKMDSGISVDMVFKPEYDTSEFQLNSYACAFWNFEQKDWDTLGCKKVQNSMVSGGDGFLQCHCNHTTHFAILMSFKKNYVYSKPLDTLSTVGCWLSICGLALTIIFQIVTRKGRKTSVTWVLVSLCTSMLIFNLLFLFGIGNSNKDLKSNNNSKSDSLMTSNQVPSQDFQDPPPNHTCTVIAAFLHYFLLVTFTWNGLSAAQLYFLLIRTMKPLPQRFILYISLIGWGVPAVVVALTVGIIYAKNEPNWELKYRQEEICWLANSEDDIKNSPLLWSLIIPVTIILINNVVIFIIIIVKVLWKDNHKLTSTKKVSFLKKILSTLSIGVIFGITWILSYFMLIDNDSIRIIFSYLFCIFNTTQGVQIFILYTVRTKIFQNQVSKMFQSLSTSSKSMRPSMTPLRLRVRMYNMLRVFPALNERFTLLNPSVDIEETTLTESISETPSI